MAQLVARLCEGVARRFGREPEIAVGREEFLRHAVMPFRSEKSGKRKNKIIRGYGAVGSAFEWHSKGHEFESR